MPRPLLARAEVLPRDFRSSPVPFPVVFPSLHSYPREVVDPLDYFSYRGTEPPQRRHRMRFAGRDTREVNFSQHRDFNLVAHPRQFRAKPAEPVDHDSVAAGLLEADIAVLQKTERMKHQHNISAAAFLQALDRGQNLPNRDR